MVGLLSKTRIDEMVIAGVVPFLISACLTGKHGKSAKMMSCELLTPESDNMLLHCQTEVEHNRENMPNTSSEILQYLTKGTFYPSCVMYSW
jgi:hypothetical protein